MKMIKSAENDFDSDCSTPTRYLERRQNKPSTDQSFFSTINSPVFRETKCQLSFSSVASATMTSIESSSCSFEESERKDMHLYSTSSYFRNNKPRKLISKRGSSHDGSTVFYDACDNSIREVSSVTLDNLEHPKLNRNNVPTLQPLYQQDSLQNFDQSYDGSYHVDLGMTPSSKSSPESLIQDISVHLQCSSDLSDLYSPSGGETILKPNSFDFSSIWNHIINWRGNRDSTNFCSTFCQNPGTPLNMKQYYHHMHPFDDSYNSSFYNSPVRNNLDSLNGIKTEKRKNTLPDGHECNGNFYASCDNTPNRNDELHVYRTNLYQQNLNDENRYNQSNKKVFVADEVNKTLCENSRMVGPLKCLDSKMNSMESIERNISTRYSNHNVEEENTMQTQNVCSKPKLSLKPPLIVRRTTSGTSASLSPSNTMQTNGTRHRRQNSIGCNTFTAESLAQIFDTRASSQEQSPTQSLIVPKTIKTVKKKNRLGIQDDDISPLGDDDDDLRQCLRNQLSQVDVAVEDDSQCSPIHRKNEAFDFTNYTISTDLFGVKSDEFPIELRHENTPMILKCHRGQYLPLSDYFRKGNDYKMKDVTFEGWVAFSKGTRLKDALLEDEKSIQRKDLRYIVLASGKLHVFASKMSYENQSGIFNKKILKLRCDFTVSISSLSKQHGQCVMVRDHLGVVKCTILPVNLNNNLFCDAACSEVVSIPEFRKQRHTLFAIHSSNHEEHEWLTDLSNTVPFEQNTAVLWLQFSLDAAIRMREMHKHSRNLSCGTFSSRDTFTTRSTCSSRDN